MTEPRLAEALRRLQADFEVLGIRWGLVGGLAVSARAEPRTTRDIDVAIAVAGDRQAETLIRRLRDRGYLDEVVMEHRDMERLSTVRLTRRGGAVDLFFDLDRGKDLQAEIQEQLRQFRETNPGDPYLTRTTRPGTPSR